MSARDNPQANRPASGSYGEKADEERLRRSLPPMEAQTQPPAPGVTSARPSGPPPGIARQPVGRPQGETPPVGLPGALATPGTGAAPPGTYVDPAAAMAQLPTDQRTVYMLDLLASSPDVSGDTREWARTVLSILFDSSEMFNELPT